MPADLRYGQSIIEAYAQGRLEALQREKLAKDAAQQQVENQQRQQQIDEQKRQFEEKLKQDAEQFKATQAASKADFELKQVLALPAFQKLAESSGSIPGASAEPYVEPTGEVNPNKTTFHLPQALGGYNVNALTPEAAGELEARQQNPLIQLKSYYEGLHEKNKFDQEDIMLGLRQKFEAAENAKDRAARLEIAQIQAGKQLDSKDKTFAEQIGNRFDTSKITNNYVAVRDALDFVKSLDLNSQYGTDDTALVFAFVKAIQGDQSTVREMEFKTAQSTAESLANQFKFNIQRIHSHAPFLSPGARKQMIEEIQNKYDTYEKGYDNYRAEQAKKISSIGLNPEIVLSNHKKGFETLTRGKAPTVVDFNSLPKGKK